MLCNTCRRYFPPSCSLIMASLVMIKVPGWHFHWYTMLQLSDRLPQLTHGAMQQTSATCSMMPLYQPSEGLSHIQVKNGELHPLHTKTTRCWRTCQADNQPHATEHQQDTQANKEQTHALPSSKTYVHGTSLRTAVAALQAAMSAHPLQGSNTG